MSIERLRRIAELNFCRNCYRIYKSVLEPNIEPLLYKPLSDWRDVESYITQMVMKLKGVFKGESIFVSIDDEPSEKIADIVDIETFRNIEKWGFRKKTKYLHKQGIFQDPSYNFLNEVSLVRNRIHDENYEFSEQDLALFHSANAIASRIYLATMFSLGEDIAADVRSNAEKVAEQLLSRMDRAR